MLARGLRREPVAYCRDVAAGDGLHGRHWGAENIMFCIVCGKEFDARTTWQLCCCDDCRKKRKEEVNRSYYQKVRAGETPKRPVGQDSKPAPLTRRRCHDCGKPTTNYRCAACWRKRGRCGHVGEENVQDEFLLEG